MMVGFSSDVPELEGDGGNPGVSSRVQAVVNFYGPTDLTTEYARKHEVIRGFFANKTYEEVPEQYRLASPITHVTSDDPPTLIFQGTIDELVPVEQSDMLAKKLEGKAYPTCTIAWRAGPTRWISPRASTTTAAGTWSIFSIAICRCRSDAASFVCQCLDGRLE